jgi:hypothetical protein
MFKSLGLSEKCAHKKCGNKVSKNKLNKLCDEMNRNINKQCRKIKDVEKNIDCEVKVYKKSRCCKLTTKLIECSE